MLPTERLPLHARIGFENELLGGLYRPRTVYRWPESATGGGHRKTSIDVNNKKGVVSLKRGNSFLVQKKHSDYEKPNACGRM